MKNRILFIHVNHHNLLEIESSSVAKNWVQENVHCFFDGIALKIFALLNGKGLVYDLNGTDLFPLVLTKLNALKSSVYLVGGNSCTIEKTLKNLKINYPQVDFCGRENGYFTSDEFTKIISNINSAAPELLILSMGIDKEVDFLMKSRDRLCVPVIWCVGGLFEFISYNKPRAPLILRKLRLEWFFRFCLEPRRLFTRYFLGVPKLLEINIKYLNNKGS
ncbi:WecB/TagA/CpsF family glycosyltransferase [Candidatus Nomurabacteria bacterium]|nr:WecB/TagA/CpsF family glycosyltransferase [Candidatus Nomurabacteria bacterium]